MKIQLENPVSKFDIDSNGLREYSEVNVNVIIHDLYSKSVYCNTDFGRVEIISTEDYDENNPYNFTNEDIVNKVKNMVTQEYSMKIDNKK